MRFGYLVLQRGKMENLIIIFTLVVAVGAACLYIIREKKKGNRCIGCPSGGCKNCKGCMDGKSTDH